MRSRIFNAAMENGEIAEAVKTSGVAYVYDIFELPDKHAVLVLTAETQMNDNTLKESGFSPAAHIRRVLVVHGQRKTVDF